MNKQAMIEELARRTGQPESEFADWSIGALAAKLTATPDSPYLPKPDSVKRSEIEAIVLEKLDAYVPKAEVDAKLLGKLVRGHVDEAVAKVQLPLTVKVERADTVVEVKGVHCQFPTLLALASLKRNGRRRDMYIHGAAGGGKTHAGWQLAEALGGLPFASINLMPQSPKSDVFGYMDAMGKYHETAFVRLYRDGGVYLADEFDNCSASIAVSLHPALANGWLELPNGERVNRHEDFIFIAAANTAGRGGSINHTGRQALDGATIDRFVFVEWRYDTALEAAMVRAINPHAEWWLNWVRAVRQYCAEAQPALIASPRAAADGAELLTLDTFTRHEVAEMALFKGISREIVRNVLANVPLPTEGS